MLHKLERRILTIYGGFCIPKGTLPKHHPLDSHERRFFLYLMVLSLT
jgi:hypothetical protein